MNVLFAFPVASWKYSIYIDIVIKQSPLIRKVMRQHLFKRHFIRFHRHPKCKKTAGYSLGFFDEFSLVLFFWESFSSLHKAVPCNMAITVSSAYVQSCLSFPGSADGESGRPHSAISWSCWCCRDHCVDVFWQRSSDSLMDSCRRF